MESKKILFFILGLFATQYSQGKNCLAPTKIVKACDTPVCCTGNGGFVIENKITICPCPSTPCYNDSLTWGPDEMHPQDQDDAIALRHFTPYSSPYNAITYEGWPLPSSLEQTNYITVQFEVPQDIDTTVEPYIVIHFFATFEASELGYAKFHVDMELLNNEEGTGSAPTYGTDSSDIFVTNVLSPHLLHYQIAVPLTDISLTPGEFGAITISRVAPDGDEKGTIYLSALSFNYRKAQCQS